MTRRPAPARSTAGWRFDPAGYPGRRPAGPVLVTADAEQPLELTDDPDRPVRLPGSPASTGVAGLAVPRPVPPVLAAPGARRWIVAYGANADPDRLRDKGLVGPGAVLLPAVVEGWTAAFEARCTGYGAVPLTFVPAPGVRTRTWVLGVHLDVVDELDRTEGRSPGPAAATADPPDGAHHAPVGTYRLGRVGEVEVAGRFLLEGALAYLPGPATRVQRHAGGWRSWPGSDQAAARAHLAARGPWAPAPEPAVTVVGPWPATPLRRA